MAKRQIARRIAVKNHTEYAGQREMANNQSVRRHLDDFKIHRVAGMANNWEDIWMLFTRGRPQCDKCGCRVRNCSHHRFTTLETILNYRNS
ncbi:hypothetical protein TNCV_2792501 [Trichonephila clavipes]|nr:hypothetical protein TNCV_2792501 [Trichonephila clavipes]